MEPSQQPLLSIVIASAGSATLAECLIESGRLASEVGGEVILALDPSTAGKWIEVPSFVRTVRAEKSGVSAARNAGLSAVRGKMSLLLDDDCLVGDRDWFQSLQKAVTDREGRLHGGSYGLSSQNSYWSRVYAWVNQAWLERGKGEVSQAHLLGGFLFGSSRLKERIVFSTEMKWGGEEKELLTRLHRQGTEATWHPHLRITHQDQSGLSRFLRRAFRQGEAAGHHDLATPTAARISSPPWSYLPGLVIFYSLSRTGMALGCLRRLKNGKVKNAATSPKA